MAGLEPGHDGIYRAAQADFNVRGWQGRLRYTALTALFFSWLQNLPFAGRIARPSPPRFCSGTSRILAGW
jgi:hypothetical protein